MPEVAEVAVDKTAAKKESSGIGTIIKKRWRGWLRAVHRDFGYLAVGFTLIYAISGIAINHISDWDPNFTSVEKSLTIAPIPVDLPDDQAVKIVTDAAGTGKPDDVYRAGDEIRLTYSSGTQVTAIGESLTVQGRSPRFFLRVANWLHYNRGKKAWTYMADLYAFMLLYLAISGIFMIKGRMGLRWRGAILIGLGLGVPLTYVVVSGGPNAHQNAKTTSTKVEPVEAAPAPPPDDEFARPPDRMAPRTAPAEQVPSTRSP